MPDLVAAPSAPTLQDGVLKAHTSIQTDTANDLLGRLIQKDQYVGELLDPTFEHAKVLVHDHYRQKVGGIPSLCYLIATRLTPGQPINPDEEDSCIVLLRVLDGTNMPDEAEKQQVRHQAASAVLGEEGRRWDDETGIDAYTADWLSHSGLKCRIVGTFYLERKGKSDLQLRLGADLSNYYPNRALHVYKPVASALDAIVNHTNTEDGGAAKRSFDIGTIRYSSTRRNRPDVDDVQVRINPEDLLGQKTALFGMTRTGKSNTTKILIQSVFNLRYKGRRVGQLVLDPDGEYSNPNPQDGTPVRQLTKTHSKGDPNDVIVYGMNPKADDPHRRLLRLNFYADEHLEMGKDILCATLAQENMDQSNYVKSFREVSLAAPDPQDKGATVRHRRHVLVYRALLATAGFTLPVGLNPQTAGLFNTDLLQAMAAGQGKDPQGYIMASQTLGNQNATWQQLGLAFRRLYEFMHDKKSGYTAFEVDYAQKHPKGDEWADANLRSLLEMIGRPGGAKMAAMATSFHDPTATSDYAQQIYEELRNGKLVIVDQSSGSTELNRKAADRIMQHVFNGNFKLFTEDVRPLPEILMYVEEAHNILPRGNDEDLQNIWVRTAKEGAKAAIGLVYATQEVTSIQRNILKNTSNWFIAHLNNAEETKEISKYSDFSDYEDSIRRCPDRGFLRVKTLSNPFVVPVQIKRFEV